MRSQEERLRKKKKYFTHRFRDKRRGTPHRATSERHQAGQVAEDSAVGEGYWGFCGKGKAGSGEPFRTGLFVIWTGFGLLGGALVAWHLALR